MIDKAQYISEKERNDYLEVDTSEKTARLTIWHWTNFEEIELTCKQVQQLIDQLDDWLAVAKMSDD